jgi:parvulin-like peptidyl-prolyl isomerase
MCAHSFLDREGVEMMRRQAIARKLLGLALWLGCTAVVSAQTPPGKPPAKPDAAKPESYVSPVSANIPAAADKPAAMVNGEMVSMAEVKALLESRPYPVSMTADQIKGFRQAAVEMLVDDMLVRQFLGKYAPKVSPADIAKEQQNLEALLKKENKTLQDVLKENGQTMQQLQKDVANRLQWRSYLNTRLNEEQARKYYDDNKPFFDKVYVRASHILVKVPAGATAEQKQMLLNRAQTIRTEVAANKITFDAAAKQYSDCPSKDKGGDIGPFPYKFIVVETFARAAFSLKIGEMSDVVATDFGYHIIKVTDRNQPKELSTYESVRDAVRDIWSQDVELYQQIIAHQRKNSKIEVFLQ